MAAKPEAEELQEDATELRFGKDFDTADALLVSEVKMLLEHRKAQHESQDDDQDLSEVFTKTLDYCQTFSKYNSRETISAIRGALQKHKLHKFEVACLANLAPADADEAKTLLPSLQGRFDDLELNELLDDIRTHMNYQY
ncbi:PREDICTED: DNA-directed RNA polymerase II subunit RPB4-like [Amphimedon queenslandica]|uniref:RNA polymerase Rpb4/RPC9 core domain-containing protein n=1 Tax=Amphimedon queenslandica TaxID=400682 RepID=A0A1X7URM2_AMPQE|nr:PREDICTED: DNA-directed RNA polymerase II subunit RPB4-like [Amphimedon queenslandica]|eukprot:XP_003386979.1 PREDICTED: DNA-directed RNA polymerase II subunit RPB4-like [Amphimedon queenslandica]